MGVADYSKRQLKL